MRAAASRAPGPARGRRRMADRGAAAVAGNCSMPSATPAPRPEFRKSRTSTPATISGPSYFQVNQTTRAGGGILPRHSCVGRKQRPNLKDRDRGSGTSRIGARPGPRTIRRLRLTLKGAACPGRSIAGELVLAVRRDRLTADPAVVWHWPRRRCSRITVASSCTVRDVPGVGQNLQDHLQLRCVYKVQRRRDIERNGIDPLGQGEDRACNTYWTRQRADVNGAEPGWRLRPKSSDSFETAERAISCPAAQPGQVRRSAARLPGNDGERSAISDPRAGARWHHYVARPDGGPGDPAELPLSTPGGPPRRRRFHPADPPDHGGSETMLQRYDAGGAYLPGAQCRGSEVELEEAAGTYRHHDLPPGLDLPDGRR